MKALSVKQPSANMISSGEKTIETRTWRTPYRGQVLIVSSKRPRIEPAGCAVAVATLTDCRPMTREDERAACCRVYPKAKAWVLEGIRRVEPIPVRGALGLFDCPLELGDLRWLDEASR
ncbi:MAG: ASCH domain-containing protein [Acidobacteria bacterium]|nr:ASCH domain-containing protein [Acidobacteriota bacterium]